MKSMYNSGLRLLLVVGLVGLAGCGGGGGSAGTLGGANSATSGTIVPTNPSVSASAASGTKIATVDSFIYQLDKNSLTNSGTDSLLVTVTALDANNNPIVGAAMSGAVDSGVYTPISVLTNASGQASASITIGGNKSNRSILATLTVGGKSTKITIPVTGSQISLTPLPGTSLPGGQVNLSAKVTDVNGVGVANSTVQLSGTAGFNQTIVTDSNGVASAQLSSAPTVAATYSIDATASGVKISRDLQVVSASGVDIAAASGVISVASLSAAKNNLPPNTVGSTLNRVGLTAVFLDNMNKPISRIRVRFEIVSPQLDAAETVSTGTTTVYSDSAGNAIADYIPGVRSSPTGGVQVRMCYGNSDAEIAAGACGKSRSLTLTVSSQPLSITLGDNNELVKGTNNLTYIKLFDVAVADAAGVAVPNAQISASIDLVRYGKGLYKDPRVFCLNIDSNRNGFLDANEIAAGDGSNVISPRKADAILSFVGSNTTAANGRTTIRVEYPQNVATWLDYAVKVTTSVAGSEGSAEKRYITSFVIGDDSNGSFLTPPYGVNNCNTPN